MEEADQGSKSDMHVAENRLQKLRDTLRKRAEFTMTLPKIDDRGVIAGESSIDGQIENRKK